MAESQGRSIGGICRLGGRGQAKTQLHHALHLFLVGTAVTSNRVLHLIGRVLGHLTPGVERLNERQSTGLSDAHGRADVHLEEDSFHGNRLRAILGDEGTKIIPEQEQTFSEFGIGRCSKDTHRHCPSLPRTEGLDAGIPAPGETRVDAEDEHGFDCTLLRTLVVDHPKVDPVVSVDKSQCLGVLDHSVVAA